MKKELIFAALSTGLFVISALDTEVYPQGRGKGNNNQYEDSVEPPLNLSSDTQKPFLKEHKKKYN